jgi:autotransporter-associated beta strand protein
MFAERTFGWPLILAVWSGVAAQAATFIKADNTVDLNLAASWTNNAVPGSADIAAFDGTISAPNNTANIGTNLTWYGITLSNNLNSSFTIGATGTNVLTIAGGGFTGGGINMTNANQDLTINAPVLLVNQQFWDFNSGRTLTFNGDVRTVSSAPGAGSPSRGLGSVNGGGTATINFNGNFTDTNAEFGPLQNYNYVININPGANGFFFDNQKLTIGKYNNANVTVNILSGTNNISPGTYVVLGDGNANTAGIGNGIGSGTLNILGGQTTITNNGQPFVIGLAGNGTVNVNNSTLIAGGDKQIRLGGNGTANASLAPIGTLNITNGGTVIVTPSTGQSMVVGDIPTGTGIINIYTNSTLIAGRQMYGIGTGYVNLYGGTVRVPSGVSALSGGVLFQNNLTQVMIGEGGATIDDGGAAVLINAPLQHDATVAMDGGLTKMGSGALTFNFDPSTAGAGVYNGNTVVAEGTLKLPAVGLTWSSFTVNSGAKLNLWRFNSLAVAEVTGITFNDGASFTIDEGLPAGTPDTASPLLYVNGLITTAGTVTVNVTNAVFNTPGEYQLINYGYFGGSLAGAGFAAFQLGSIPVTPGLAYSLVNNTGSGTIDLMVSQIESLTWDGTVNNVWDVNGTANWKTGQTYTETGGKGPLVTFDDTLNGTQNTDILLNATVNPGGTLFNNLSYNYSLTGSGSIAGTNAIFVSGGGHVTIANTNTTSGGVQVTSGTLQLGDGAGKNGSLSGPITLVNGGAFVVANSVDQTLANSISGTGNFILNSPNALILAASNDLSHVAVTVNGGTMSNSVAGGLAVGALNLAGTFKSRDSLMFSGTTNAPLTFMQNSVIDTPAMLFLAGAPNSTYIDFDTNTVSFTNQYVTYDTSIFSVQNWQGNGGVFNTYGSMIVSNWIQLSGVTWNANLGTNTATISKLVIGKDGGPAVVNLNSGRLNAGGQNYLGIGDTANAVPNSSTSMGTLNINGGIANIGANTRYLIGNGGVGAVNVSAGQLNFLGNGSSIMLGGDSQYAHNGSTGILTISGTGSVTVSNGSGGLQLGAVAGGATGISGTINLFGGTLTTWPAIVYAGTVGSSTASLVFSGGTLKSGTNQANWLQGLTSAMVSTNGAIIDDGGYTVTIGQSLTTDPGLTGLDGGFIKLGSGTLILTNASSYTGNTVVSAGTLQVNGALSVSPVFVSSGATLGGNGVFGGAVVINSGGILAPGTNGPAALTINNNLSLSGSLTVAINKNLAVSNSLAIVSGILTNAGTGLVSVTNYGPDLIAGDSFYLFNKPLLGGDKLTVVPTGNVTWTNKLAVDGSIQVLSVAPPINPLPGTIQYSISSGSLSLSWPTNLGWILQTQTNTLSAGLRTNWVTVPGSETLTNMSVDINPTNGAVFYRLVRP